MEYYSKLTLDREKKILILNEEALQSIDADAGDAKVILVAPLKEEGAEENNIYIINVTNSTVASDKEEDKYIREFVPADKVRTVTIKDEENEIYGIVSIDDETIKSFDKVFKSNVSDFKLAYQENVVGDMKSFKEMYDLKGIYHKIVKPAFKKSVIGKTNDVDQIEEVINLKPSKE